MTRRSRTRLAAIAAVLLIILTACGTSGEPEAYDEQFDEDGVAIEEANFLRACIAVGQSEEAQLEGVQQAGLQSVCECGWREIRANVPFEDFERWDSDLRDDQSTALPEQLTDILTGCIRGS